MKELIIKALHDYILISIAAKYDNYNAKEAEDKQFKILDSVKNNFTEQFTAETFKATVDKIKDNINATYYNSEKETKIIRLITDFLVDNKIKDIDVAKNKLEKLWEYLSSKEGDYKKDAIIITLKEIYAVEINTFIISALEAAKNKIEDIENQELLQQTQSEDEKRATDNLKSVGESVTKAKQEEGTGSVLVDRTLLFAVFGRYGGLINKILNYICLLDFDKVTVQEKDEIVYTLGGNTNYIKVFCSYEFVNTYLAYLYRSVKEDGKFIYNLEQQGFLGLADMLKNASIERATKYIINTLASCLRDVKDIPEGFAKIRHALEEVVPQFNVELQDTTIKRKESQKLIKTDIDPQNWDEETRMLEEAAFQRAKKEREEAEELYGGPEGYNRFIREQNESKKIKKLTSLQGSTVEDSVNCHTEPDFLDVSYEIKGVLQDILDFYNKVFDLTVKMQRFSGIYMFKDSKNNDSECGVMELVIGSDGTSQLKTIERKASALLKWLRDDYEYPIRDTLKVARHNQVPSLENIMVKGYNYYPVFVARYALGFVAGVRYNDFKTFLKKVRADLENRLYKIYKDKIEIDGELIEGKKLFEAANPNRVRLVGAFVNSIIFLTGSSKENFDSAQIRCICAYPHTKDATYYTEFSTDGATTKGLSDAASVKYLEVNKTFAKNVIDITYMKDKEAFFNTISWAYQELGKVYSSGVIPKVGNNEPVVIGQELSGNLVEFSLGINSQFTTSIYAGSRSGKGVTTLSILAAIMAGKIGICYLDCKPDMANCFWDMENKLPLFGLSGRTYSYDTNADTSRLGKTPMEAFQKIVPKSSKLYSVVLAEALFVLKQLQMVILTGLYKKKIGDSETIVWVFDEINNIVNKLSGGFSKVLEVSKDKDSSAEDKALAKRFYDFWKYLQTQMSEALTATWGVCGYKFICIGQKPQEIFGSQPGGTLAEASKCTPSNGADILRFIAQAPPNRYILGRGLNIQGGFGTKAFHNDKGRSDEEKAALEVYRYFIMRTECQQNTGVETGSNTTLFKPFLTLNFDDVLEGCWTGGVGKSVGGFEAKQMGTPGESTMLMAYKQAMNSNYGPNTKMSDSVLQDNKEGHGIVDEGTGFYGLVKTYLNGDDKEVLTTAIRPYMLFTKYFMEMHLIGEGSLFGYNTLDDFLYDFSEKPMKIATLSDLDDAYEEFKAGGSTEETSARTSDGGIDIEEEKRALGSAKYGADEDADTGNQASMQQASQVQPQIDEAQLDAERQKAAALADIKQKQDRVLNILQEVKGYGSSLDLLAIDKELNNIQTYSSEITQLTSYLSNIVRQYHLDYDNALSGVNSIIVVLMSKKKELTSLREQVVSSQQLEEQQQTKDEIEQQLIAGFEAQEPIVEDINVDEAATELASASDTAFTPDETVDIDLRSYYVDADYMKNVNKTLTEFEGIYRKCLNTKNELSKQILQNGVKGEEITKLLATIASLRQNIEDTLTPVYEKKEKLEEAINLIYEDVDNGDFEKADKLETYKANFDDLKDISNLKSGIDTLENDVLELEQINEVMLGILTTYNAGKQLVNKINQVINTSKINLNHSLVERDLQSLSSEIEELKLGSNQLLKNDGDTLPLTVQLKIDELDNAYKDIQNKLAQIQQAQQVNAEQQRKQEEDAQNLLKQADNKLQQDIAEQAQTIEDMESLADSSDSAGLGGQTQNQMVGGQAQSQMVGSQGQATGQQVTGAQQGVQTATGNQAQSQNQDDFIFDDSTGVVDMTQGPSMMAQPGQTQRVQADPSVKLQAGMPEYATRVMPNGSAVSKAANYLEDAIRESLPDLEEGRRRTSSIGFVDRAFVKKNLKDRYKLLVRVIGEGVGWVDVTRLDMLADRFVVNNQFTIPVQGLGDDGYNIYEIIDYADLLFKRAIRLKYLIIDQEVAENMIAECGGDVFELLFTNIQTMQVIQFGNTKITRNNRDKSIEMAIKAEVDRASNKSKAKNAMAENLFASGQLKKTQQNMSIANKVLRRAAKTGGKVGNTKGIMQAKRFLNLTPMQAVTSAVAGVFIGVIGLFSRAR